MRKTMLLTAVLAGTTLGLSFAAQAQQGVTTAFPPDSHSSQAMPQSPNSLPAGAATGSRTALPGDDVTTTRSLNHAPGKPSNPPAAHVGSGQ